MRKKITLILVTLIVFLGSVVFTPLNIYAVVQLGWMQPPIQTLFIYDAGGGANQYNVRLQWHQPQNTTQRDNQSIATMDNPTYATRFEVQVRNATARETTFRVQQTLDYMAPDGAPPGPIPAQTYNNMPLERNSLYEFRIVPIRFNWRYLNNVAYEHEVTPTNLTNERRALYLTYIDIVSSHGSGDQLAVTWNNPTHDGRDVFTAYDIFYVEQAGNVNRDFDKQPRRVNMNDPMLMRNSDGTLTYIIEDADLVTGERYNLKVEPVYEGSPVRGRNEGNQIVEQGILAISIAGREYSIAYKPVNFESREVAYVAPKITLALEGKDMVRIDWTGINTYTTEHMSMIHIYTSYTSEVLTSGREEGRLANLIGNGPVSIIEGVRAEFFTYDVVNHGGEPKYYQIAIFLNSGTVLYSEVEFFDPTYGDFSPYSPRILQLAPNLSPMFIEATWLAFIREPYNEMEREGSSDNYGGRYIDPNVTYDIYVTDNFENFNRTDRNFNNYPVYRNLQPMQDFLAQPFPPLPAESFDPSYSYMLYEYYAFDDTINDYVLRPIEPNKMYYVKIVATRIPSGQVSEPAYASVYMPTDGEVDVEPLMIAAPPLRLKEPPGIDHLNIHWDTRYIEIYNPLDDTWYACIGVHPTTGSLIYGKSAIDLESISGGSRNNWFILNDVMPDYNRIYQLNMQNPAHVNDFLFGSAGDSGIRAAVISRIASLGGSLSTSSLFRIIDLTGADYEIHVVAYEEMMQYGESGPAAYEAYMDMFLSGLEGNSNWHQINPIPADISGMLEYTVTSSHLPPGTLQENTSYVIFLRPYEVRADTKYAYYPNYVMGTTEQDKPDLEIDPTVPVLHPHEEFEMELSVYWEFMNFEYEIRYSERLADYPEGGERLILWEEFEEFARLVEQDDGRMRMYFTIENLFPNTTYYIWIRARAMNPSGPALSGWSNPIEMQTNDIRNPRPPQGLGPAGRDHINEFNRLNGTNYSTAEPNALNISWMRDGNDRAEPGTDGSAVGGTALLLPLAEVASMYISRFEGLIANRSYYIRAKTVLTVSRTGPGAPATRTYNYVVQVSLTPDFRDYIEFTVPPLEGEPGTANASNFLRRESEWTTTIRLVTGRSAEEYDGDVNPDQYPVPESDFEYVYDPATRTLTYRFRSNRIDVTGMRDQNADQRFISRLISQRVFTYKVDVTEFRNQQIDNRVIDIPYSIIKAFDERKISLEITAGPVVLTIPPGSLNTSAVRALPNFGVGSDVKITLSNDRSNLPTLGPEDDYISPPVKIAAEVTTPTRTVNITQFASPVNLNMAVSGQAPTANRNIGQYLSTANTGGWERTNAAFNSITNAFNANTLFAGAYSGIALAAAPPSYGPPDATRAAMERVRAELNITDMTAYDASQPASLNNINNLIAATANNRTSVAMNRDLPTADINTLSRARLLVPVNSQEAVINSLVTLYELKTKRVINPSQTTANTPYTGIRNASVANQRNLLKAADIGMLDASFNPRAAVTMGELMTMLDIILMDAP